MVANQAYIYAEQGALKLIADPGEVRVKFCPWGDGSDPEHQDLIETGDDVREVSLSRGEVNHLIKRLRELRDRVYGADE